MLHLFPPQVQFGHAGACANQASETAVAKNSALKEAGAFVPKSFDELGDIIRSVQSGISIPSVNYASLNVPLWQHFYMSLSVFFVSLIPAAPFMMISLPRELSSQPRRCLPPLYRWITPGHEWVCLNINQAFRCLMKKSTWTENLSSCRSWAWSVSPLPSWPVSVTRGVRSSSTQACPSLRSSSRK